MPHRSTFLVSPGLLFLLFLLFLGSGVRGRCVGASLTRFAGLEFLLLATLFLLFAAFSLRLFFSPSEDRRWHVPGRPQTDETEVFRGTR